VQKKVEGQEITMAEEPEGGAQVIDLMEACARAWTRKPEQPRNRLNRRRRPKRANHPNARLNPLSRL